ncbi:MAG TPA: NPCBM/NEW2 domain-containing protein [Phycisphaerae bacterium]|nr:NPCBM/NEW2 domain-containing protein [Phycisphaerae bacterium]HRW55921.1 NPCBM/NEW2 domain-containing protein [Phycisphaerae bacterium]
MRPPTIHHRIPLVCAFSTLIIVCAVIADEPTPQDTRASTNVIRLESLNLDLIQQDWGRPGAAKSIDGAPLAIAGKTYDHGLGTHAYSEMNIELFGDAKRFTAYVGLDDEVQCDGAIVFVVIVDDKDAWRSPVMKKGDAAKALSIDLTGAKTLSLIVEDADNGIDCDHADWANAVIELAPGAKRRPETVSAPTAPDPIIAMSAGEKPCINPPCITGATPGRAFLFRIPTTGERPITFSAENLPDGVTLDRTTGILSGSLRKDGETKVRITAKNAHGEFESTLTIVGGKHKLALTPPMGWNSWNVWGTSIDDARVRAAADWMVRSGLADCGYQYINIDDGWEADRDRLGRILTNEKFPDMKALADYVHSKGLKLGIYSGPGPKTCAGYEASYQHELLDAQSYAAWGIDYLKYDWCSYGEIAKDGSLAELRKPYEIMQEALDCVDRDIVYSLCQYGMGNVSEWGADVGGNLWRTTGDITDTWQSLASIGFGQAGLEQHAGPGHWNDPDMLVVGQVGWGPTLHPTRLSKHEQVTHITLWSLLASPLLIGCDMTQLDDFTHALLANPEVVGVNQDPLGRQASRIWVEDRLEIWARPLADGSTAVGLFNRGRKAHEIHVDWKLLKRSGPQNVRDLWRRENAGQFETEYKTIVQPHGATLLMIYNTRQ